MHYYGTRLSENISRREPEGYLLCLNVPVARTGTQEYLPEELGLPAGSSFIQVYRPEEEVFSPECVASFEGMPVTNDHPPDGVDIGNIRALQKGHAHNVRRGSGEESDLLLADLIITDPHLIDLILGGKREISCGYTYELCEENGQFIQRKIRGNHVAVVDAGRAGKRVSIRDSTGCLRLATTKASLEPSLVVFNKAHKTYFERSNPKMKKSLYKKLVRMARDGDPEAIEAVAEIVEELTEPEEAPAEATAEAAAEAAEEIAEDPAAVVETEAGTTVVVDEDTLAGVLERLDRIIALLSPAAPAGDEDPAEQIAEAVGEALEAAAEEPAPLSGGGAAEEIAELVEEILDPAASVVLTPEGEEDECEEPEEEQRQAAGDALRAALMAVPPRAGEDAEEAAPEGLRGYRVEAAEGEGHRGVRCPGRPEPEAGGGSRRAGPAHHAKRNISCRK